MSDRYYGRIEIGGQLNKELLEEFIGVLEDELCETDLEGITAQINEAVAEVNVLCFEDGDARDGQFDNTQTFCRRNGLKYVVTSGAYYGILPTIQSFDDNEERILTCDADDLTLIRKSIIVKALSLITLFVTDPSSIALHINSKDWLPSGLAKFFAETGCNDVAEALRLFIEREYPEPVEVPAFELI